MFDLYLRLWYKKAISTSQFKKPRTQNSLFPGQKESVRWTQTRDLLLRARCLVRLLWHFGYQNAAQEQLFPNWIRTLFLSSFSARHIHFPGESRVASDPATGGEHSCSYHQIGGLSKKKSRKFLARTRPLCAVKRHYSLLQIKEYFKPSHWHLLRVCLHWYFSSVPCVTKAIVLIGVNAGSFIGGLHRQLSVLCMK